MKQGARAIKPWLPVLLWAAIIFFFSSNPDPYRYLPESWRTLVPIRQVSDSSLAEWLGQLMHLLEYAVLAFLLSRALFTTHQSKISSVQNSSRIEDSFLNSLKASKGYLSGGCNPGRLRTYLSEQQLIQRTPRSLTRGSLTVVLLAMAFALSDEIHQRFVPGRAFQVIDLFIDLLGSLFGVVLYTRLKIEPQRHEEEKKEKTQRFLRKKKEKK